MIIFAACVLRLWQVNDEVDSMITTWGINFSGLVYLGDKLPDLQPLAFIENTVILYLRGGYFTSFRRLSLSTEEQLPFIDYLNILSSEDKMFMCRYVGLKFNPGDMGCSYNVEKLRRLQSLQIGVKNRHFDVQLLKEKIFQMWTFCQPEVDCSPDSMCSPETPETEVGYAPQLLTMNCLNKMLEVR